MKSKNEVINIANQDLDITIAANTAGILRQAVVTTEQPTIAFSNENSFVKMTNFDIESFGKCLGKVMLFQQNRENHGTIIIDYEKEVQFNANIIECNIIIYPNSSINYNNLFTLSNYESELSGKIKYILEKLNIQIYKDENGNLVINNARFIADEVKAIIEEFENKKENKQKCSI